MKSLIVIICAITVISTAYAGPDLTCEAILEPSGDYCLADSVVTPRLKITNLGDQGASNFWVFFKVVRTSDDSITYFDSTQIGYLGQSPSSIEVELSAWTPQGKCDRDKAVVGVEYQLYGFPSLPVDEDHSNDTCKGLKISLIDHDIGTTDYIILEPPPPVDCYDPGTEVIIMTTVENFGFNTETSIPVRLSIIDKTADPDTVVYTSTQFVTTIGTRADSTSGDYSVDVVFPVWVVPSRNWFSVNCRTELESDLCPDNNFEGISASPCDGVKENQQTGEINLEEPIIISAGFSIRFTLPLPSWVRLDVYDASGRFVRNLYNDPSSAGSHSLTWDGRDSRGTMVSPGAYFIRMEAGTFGEIKKVLFLR